MAEMKAEAVGEGENVDGERNVRVSLSGSGDRSPSDPSSIQEDINTIAGTMTKSPSGPVEPESKDLLGPDNTIPLSPQWLFSKHGDGKLPMTPIDLPQTPVSASNGNNSDSVSKERWRQEGNRDADKRRDWWRTMSTEGDGSAGNRRERWREDERESSLLGRRDRWKEGGDTTDSRRADRWAENSSTARDQVENRRTSLSERRSDSTSRETNYDTRRDSKWNTRWGPEDKDKETRREKRSDFEKEGEGHRDKQYLSSNRNENDREADASARDRWRPHSITARSKGDVAPPLSSTPPKVAPGFGIGRGRGDMMSPGFAIGRGRANISGISSLHGNFSLIGSPPGLERGDGGSGFRYPRAKLLDIYRKCSSSFLHKKYPDGFNEVSQLTQADPFEPLAFFTPDMDEEAVIEGILKGDVLSSGTVHATSKEQTSNKIRESNGWNRARGRSIGSKEEGLSEASREDSPSVVNLALGQESKALSAKYAEGISTNLNTVPSPYMEGARKPDNVSAVFYQGHASGDALGTSLRELSPLILNLHAVSDSHKQSSMLEFKENNRQGDFDNTIKEKCNEAGNQDSGVALTRVSTSEGLINCSGFGSISNEKVEILDNLTALCLNKSLEVGGLSHSEVKKSYEALPEELSLFYIDPQGEVQGPFPGVDIIDWFKAGFFGTDLLVRTADSPEGTPFSQLSKVMPHLLTTSQALPAFDASKEVANYQESNDHVMKDTLPPKFLQQVVADPSLQSVPGRIMPSGRVGNLHGEDDHFSISGNADGRRERMTDKLAERERASTITGEAANLKRASSLPQRMAGVSHIQNDDLQSLLAQHWAERGSVLPELPGLIPRSSGQSLSRAERLHAAPDMFLPPVGSSTPLERSWSDLSTAKETPPHHLASHGLDAFHMHQLQQLEKHRIQQELELGLPFPQLLQQQQHLRQQQLAEHLLSSGHAHDLNLHALQQLASPRVPQRQSHHQHQQSFPIQPSESTLDQLLRLQQQQQQGPSHAYLEQLLRQHQQLPGVEHLHGAPLLTERHLRRLQEASRTDLQAQQMEQLLQRHSHELLLQRQQEHQARQHAFLQQQLSNLHEHRVSGVWEVDEFGQFVQTPVSAPMHSKDFFHQQQLQRQASFPAMPHPGALFGSSQLRLSRSDLRKLADLEMQKKLSSLLDGTSSMPAEMLAQLQSEIARFESQSLSVPEQSPFEHQAPSFQNLRAQADLRGEATGSRGWGAGLDLDKQFKEMLSRGRSGPSVFDQLSRKIESPLSNWQQDSSSPQSDVNTRAKLLAANSEETLDGVLRAHNRSERFADQSASEERSRALSSQSSLSGQHGNTPPITFQEQHHSSPFQVAASSKAKHWDSEWSRVDMGLASELPTRESSDVHTGSSNDLSGAVGEVRAATPAILTDGGDFLESKDVRELMKQSYKNQNEDHRSAASFMISGSDLSIGAEDPREILPLTSGHSGDSQQIREENASSRLAVWSMDVKKQAKTATSLKEMQDIPRFVRNELEGLPLSMQQTQANVVRLPSTVLPAGNASAWQRASSPSLPQSSLPPRHTTTMRSTTPGDDEFFWDHNTAGNLRQSSRTERFDKLSFSRIDQFGKGSSANESEGLIHTAFAGGATPISGSSELSGLSSTAKRVQAIARGLQGSKQADDFPILTPQGSLTVADAKAFREWCEQQINLRRGLNESISDNFESGPTFEALKAEFLLHKESMPLEVAQAPFPPTESAIKEKVDSFTGPEAEKKTLVIPMKSSEGEEELDMETSGQSSALKNAKKKAKKGKKVVDPSLLGFSVASNRILMGEIQHVDD